MKLIEALQIANQRHDGAPFRALLACGFTPLHLATAVKAHLRLYSPDRDISVKTGLYGDLAGTLENSREPLDAVLIVLEWGDLDPRLAWRSTGQVNNGVIADAEARLNRIAKAIAVLAERTPLTICLPTLPLPPVFHTQGCELNRTEAELRALVYNFAASTPAIILHPEMLLGGAGHDLRAELMTGFPYSFAHAETIAATFVRSVTPRVPKKGLITDLDETLWSGVLGDDGPEGISWDIDHKTQFHSLYQNLLNLLAGMGVLLAVASKNDAGLVDQAFARRDLLVKPQHLFPVEAHWGPKSESVARILQTWNVDADSVVFVDDSRLELECVQSAFPGMKCVEFRNHDPGFLVELRDHFGKREIRDEDKLRIDSLRSSQVVRQAAAGTADLDALLAGAQARLMFAWGKDPLDPRALELINKTNQFNLNGIRYTEAEWRAYLSDPAAHLVVVEYEDRFARLGKIAVLAGRERGSGFEVDVWVMSCRAFSRRIEHQCLKTLLSRWDPVQFRWKRTERNGPMQDFLREMVPGFEAIRREDFSHRCPPLFHQTNSHPVECASV